MNAPDLTRRQLLGIAAGTGAAGLAGAYGLGAFDRDADASTTEMSDERSRELAEQFAPVYYFDAFEKWFPTDPRPYESEADGDPVVDGFDALEGYTERFREAEAPPNPTVFYRVVSYEGSPLAAVQYWWYAAFDQFSVNFHWHDWEVTQVFVDLETGEPRLFVGSAHSRKVPNNEFLEPSVTEVPRVLPELGSHSGGLSVNDIPDQFTRNPVEDTIADVTNDALEDVVGEIPAAYGLPRDEGFRLPYVVPELDGEPIYEHERLQAVDREALIDERLTVRSFQELAEPPEDLPRRETGELFAFDPDDTEGEVAVTYELVPTAELEHITAFTGPQLSFEFAIPEAGEDLVAGHITTTKVPWNQPRYDNPADDISDPAHRQELADEYEAIGDPAPVNRLVAAVRQVESDEEAPEDEGVKTSDSTTEKAALVESDPAAVPTFRGVVVVDDVPAGEHRLTVNGAGEAPYSERVEATEEPGTDLAGVDGEIAIPPAKAAVKLEVNAEGTDATLENLAVEDDFGGRLYESRMDGSEAVYVHGGGAYTTEVRDATGAPGAFRVNPGDDEGRVRIETPRTGKASLSNFVSNIGFETALSVEAVTEVALDEVGDPVGGVTGGSGDGESTETSDGDRSSPTPTETDSGGDGDLISETTGRQTGGVTGLLRALKAVTSAADNAAQRAEAGDRNGANRSLRNTEQRLEEVISRLADARGSLPEPVAKAVEKRTRQAKLRTEQALETEKLQ
jgi:hypothetical protein